MEEHGLMAKFIVSHDVEILKYLVNNKAKAVLHTTNSGKSGGRPWPVEQGDKISPEQFYSNEIVLHNIYSETHQKTVKIYYQQIQKTVNSQKRSCKVYFRYEF